MTLTCYGCHQPFIPTGWNPLRQTVICPTPSCGRWVYVGLAVEREHGKVVGKQVKDILEGLGRVGTRGKESLAGLADAAATRIEKLLQVAEVTVMPPHPWQPGLLPTTASLGRGLRVKEAS
jgi:hypothetical protein